MRAVVVAAVALTTLSAVPAVGQSYAYPDQHRTWSSYSRHGYDVYAQRDRPGDYRCDAYWDRGRDDCGASWRDQRPFADHGGRGYGHRRYASNRHGAGYVYQPYNQGTQYYGAYGRPDQVYPGSGYGGQVGGYGYANGHAYSGGYGTSYGSYGGGHRDVNRSAWCASRYRSYDPVSGYYRAYSGRLIYCG